MIRFSNLVLGLCGTLLAAAPVAAQELPAVDVGAPIMTSPAPSDSLAIDGGDGFFRDYCSTLRAQPFGKPACSLTGHGTRPRRDNPWSSNWLGVSVIGMNESFARSLGVAVTRGVFVSSVDDGSPAEAAGIKPLDIIVSLAGKDVTDYADIVALDDRRQKARETGREVAFVLIRDGQEKTGTAMLPGQSALPLPEGGTRFELGMTLSILSTELRHRFGIDDGVRGVVVADVAADCQAARKHLAAGDVIVEVAKSAVLSGDEVRERIVALKKRGASAAVFLVADRAGARRAITLAIK
jgi:S1-C subfamily serine protease